MNDSSPHGSAGHTPHPARPAATADAADLARYLIQLSLAETGAGGSPGTKQPASDRPVNIRASDSPADSTFKLDVLWDNVNLPYTAFFPGRPNPYRAWSPPADAPIIHWDQPVQITEQPPTPPSPTEESSPEFEPRLPATTRPGPP